MRTDRPIWNKYNSLKCLITDLLKQGLTYPVIARQLALGNEETLRHWLIKHPELDAMRRANAKAKMKEKPWNAQRRCR